LSLLALTAAVLAGLSFLLLIWQWVVACRFPLHRRSTEKLKAEGVTVFKPLNGFEPPLRACLESWFTQRYPGPLQLLFVVGSEADPVCAEVRQLMAAHPGVDAQLVRANPAAEANAKVSKLAAVQKLARHPWWVVSDADVWAPADLLAEVGQGFAGSAVGLVNCFYRLEAARTWAMRWEGVGVNADFWSQVLQAVSLRRMDFALGAVMAVRREEVEALGGFAALQDCLADDYQLGNRIARRGRRVVLCPVVVECRSGAQGWREVWRHQARWARTVRVCQPGPYFFSLLSNATLWPLLWLAVQPTTTTAGIVAGMLLARVAAALDLMRRLEAGPVRWSSWWLVPVKDLLQVAVWASAFAGNTVWWRGEKLRLRRDGTIRRA
jgi:ceramide glucosyltransferase